MNTRTRIITTIVAIYLAALGVTAIVFAQNPKEGDILFTSDDAVRQTSFDTAAFLAVAGGITAAALVAVVIAAVWTKPQHS